MTALNERLTFLAINDETRKRLAALRPVLEQNLAPLLERFYAHVGAYPGLAAKLGDANNIVRLKAGQRAHWLGLFDGRFDDDYLTRIRAIGKAHERSQLAPQWYMGGYCMALCGILAAAIQHHQGKPGDQQASIEAICKAIFLDMELAISIYIEEGEATYQRRLDELARAFETQVGKVVDEVAAQVNQLEASSRAMTTSADAMGGQVAQAISAAAEASNNTPDRRRGGGGDDRLDRRNRP